MHLPMFKKILTSFLLVGLLLQGCGGGGGSAGTTSSGTVTTGSGAVAVAAIDIVASAPTLNAISGAITLSAYVKSAGNVGLASRAVTFVASSGVLTSVSSTTNDSGLATAVLMPGKDATPRNITITVTSGGISDVLVVPVVVSVSDVQTVELLGAASTIPSAAGSSVKLSAYVKSSGNAGLADKTVTFAATSGSLSAGSVQSDSSGIATVYITGGVDRSNRDITVLATSGGVTGTLVIPVVGSKLSITGAGSLKLGDPSSEYTVKATDSAGNALSSATLTVGSSIGNGLSKTSVVTDSNGDARLSYTPTKVANPDVISVTGLGTSQSLSVIVAGIDFTFSEPSSGSNLEIGQNHPIKVRYREAGIGIAGKVVTFASTRGTLSLSPALVTTDANGEATLTINSNSSGASELTATIDTIGQARQSFEFVSSNPTAIKAQVTPKAVAPFDASSPDRSKASVIAQVTDASGNAVKGTAVSFSVVDPTGGTVQPSTAQTDSNGYARTTYTAGAKSSATNGVTITATLTSLPSVKHTTTLSVSQSSLFITIATGNTISNKDGDVNTYQKPFSVYVVDSNGSAVANQKITLSAWATNYYKGSMVWNGVNWIPGSVVTTNNVNTIVRGYNATCINEDENKNGVLDSGEDLNDDKILTPGAPAVVSSHQLITDQSGFGTFNLLYGEQFAYWADVQITAAAVVDGTESSTIYDFPLVAMASDISDESVRPAGFISPYKIANVCSNKN